MSEFGESIIKGLQGVIKEDTPECLLGSSVQPSSFINNQHDIFTLGDVVGEAYKRSKMDVRTWNQFAREEPVRQEAAIQDVVDDWDLAELKHDDII